MILLSKGVESELNSISADLQRIAIAENAVISPELMNVQRADRRKVFFLKYLLELSVSGNVIPIKKEDSS